MSDNPRPEPQKHLPVNGLDGANPLGFLAALGVLQALSTATRARISMSWSRNGSSWVPILHGAGDDQKAIVSILAERLNCGYRPTKEAEAVRDRTQREFDDLKTELKKKLEGVKKRRLQGEARKAVEDQEINPIKTQLMLLRFAWLKALRKSVPSLELSLGKHLNATCEELRDDLLVSIDEACYLKREVADLYSAFGSDACPQEKSDQMQATRFCFVTGSGHQYFLDTVRQLVTNVTDQRLREALFEVVEPSDEKFSLRWDPQEDRRYAVMWSDPTASGNKATTNWAINLVAYHGLQLLPSVPRSAGLASTGWSDDTETAWSWPIWSGQLTSDVVRSVLANSSLVSEKVNRRNLKSLGVAAVYRAARIQVGNPPLHKINFAPAACIA